jgi:hypothetical protein
VTGTEELIRAALRRQAERTPPAGPVLAALNRPRRSRRPLLLVLAAGTAAAVIAVVTTTIDRPVAETPPATSVAPTLDESGVPVVTLEYSPTWVPEGYGEETREFTDRGVQRSWIRGDPKQVNPSFFFYVEDAATGAGSVGRAADGDRVVISGAPGAFSGDDLVWQVSPTRVLRLSPRYMPDARATVQRIAESVRPDQRPITVPLTSDGSAYFAITGSRSTGWNVATTGRFEGRQVMLGLGTRDWPQELTPVEVTALGREARYAEAHGGILRVEVGPRLYLSVSGRDVEPASAEFLARVAEQVAYQADVDVSWLKE